MWYNVFKLGDDVMNNIVEYKQGNSVLAENRIEHEYTRVLTEKTRRSYVSAIKDFFEVDNLSDITADMMRSVDPYKANDWAERMLKSGNSKATVNKKLGALCNFYKFLCRKSVGIMSYNPFSPDEGCIRYKNAIKPYSDKRALTAEEIQKLVSSIEKPEDPEKYISYLRDKIVIMILVTTGIRREELANAKIGDIQVNSGKYVLRIIGKGDKFRFAVLSEPVVKDINEYIWLRRIQDNINEHPLITSHSRNVEPESFVNDITIYRIVKKYAEKSGISQDGDIATHNLRHTFATLSLSMGADMADVQDMMGHSNMNTTRRYDHVHRTIEHSTCEKLSCMCGIG